MLLVLSGLPGVGKSSVISKASEKTNFNLFTYGDIATKIAIEKKLINNRDELRTIDLSLQLEIREQVIDALIKEKTNYEYILFETHSIIKTPKGFLPGFDLNMLEKLNPGTFINLTAPAEIILKRRNSDKKRERNDDLTLDILKRSLCINSQFMTTFATLSGATYFEIENIENQIEYAVNEIAKIIESYKN